MERGCDSFHREGAHTNGQAFQSHESQYHALDQSSISGETLAAVMAESHLGVMQTRHQLLKF
jgi:hypothetical protein